MSGYRSRADAFSLERKEGKELAVFRVHQEGGLDFQSKVMDPDQISKRRAYMRKILLVFPKWANLSNDELDQIRLESVSDGYIVEDASGCEIFLKQNQITDGEAEFRKLRSMMPFTFLDCTAKDFQWGIYEADTSNSKKLINTYVTSYERFKDNGMGLYIYSSTKGSGKTMLACCLLNEIARRYAGSVKFTNILEFIEMTKKGFNDKDEETNAVYQAGLLVLDDIGVQMSKEWIDTVLYRLVNHRYTNHLPTIYTSNIPVKHLRIDDRITDRIDSTTYPVQLPEESIRSNIMQQKKDKLLQEIQSSS